MANTNGDSVNVAAALKTMQTKFETTRPAKIDDRSTKFKEFIAIANTQMNLAKKANGEPWARFEIDKNNEKQINDLFDYFSGAEGRLKRDKSICLIGERGTGKTLLMRSFSEYASRRNSKLRFRIKHSYEVEIEFAKNGFAALEAFKESNRIESIEDLCLDDFACGARYVNFFGNQIDLNEVFFLLRYDLHVERGIKTHITTNIPTKRADGSNPLLEAVGERIYSRFKESHNIVYLTGEDHRK